MNLNKLKYFIELAECKNFTRAAAKLYMAQSNLSKQIAQFEDEVGVKLFERVRTGVELTPAGKLVYDKLKHVPALIENTLAHAREIENDNHFKIGIMEGFDFTRERFLALQAMYPNVQFTIERRSVEALRTRLLQGDYDAIITVNYGLEEFGIKSTPVRLLDVGLLISRNHPLGESTDPKVLSDATFVCVGPNLSPASYQLVEDVCRYNGISPKNFRFVEDFEDMLLSVETNLTIAILVSNNGLRAKSEICTIPLKAPDNLMEMICWDPSNQNAVILGLIKVMQDA